MLDDGDFPRKRLHACVNGDLSDESSWWLVDGHGIELCRVCDRCEEVKRRRYRPEIFQAYSQADVDEPIEADT